MRRIIAISHREKRQKDGNPYYRIYGMTEDGTEGYLWSRDKDALQVGDEVMVLFHMGQIKFRKKDG